MAAVHT